MLIIKIVAYRKCCFEHLKLLQYVNAISSEGIKLSDKLFLTNVNRKGGEGIVMRKIGSIYVCGRSADLLKVKVCVSPSHLVNLSHY